MLTFSRFPAAPANTPSAALLPRFSVLRSPAPVDLEDEEEALVELADGAQRDAEEPRIEAMAFERWYRRFYDEFEGEEQDDSK